MDDDLVLEAIGKAINTAICDDALPEAFGPAPERTFAYELALKTSHSEDGVSRAMHDYRAAIERASLPRPGYRRPKMFLTFERTFALGFWMGAIVLLALWSIFLESLVVGAVVLSLLAGTVLGRWTVSPSQRRMMG